VRKLLLILRFLKLQVLLLVPELLPELLLVLLQVPELLLVLQLQVLKKLLSLLRLHHMLYHLL
jgi:hypothetical protein